MALIEKIKAILFSPDEFFSQLKEPSIGPAFRYYAILAVVAVLLGTLVSFFFHSMFYTLAYVMGEFSPMEAGFSLIGAIIGVPLGYIFMLIGYFVVASILHVWLLLFGAKGSYEQTLQMYAYASTPQLLFGWIPIIGWFMWIYNIVLLGLATMRIHKLSALKTVFAYVIPPVLFLLFAVLLFFLFLVIFGIGMFAFLKPLQCNFFK